MTAAAGPGIVVVIQASVFPWQFAKIKYPMCLALQICHDIFIVHTNPVNI